MHLLVNSCLHCLSVSSSHSLIVYQVNPFLEAVIGVNPEAVAIAAELDEQRRKGSIKSYLHGIPVLVKDVWHSSISITGSDGERTYPLVMSSRRRQDLGLC